MKPHLRPARRDEPAQRPGSHARPLARGGNLAARMNASGPAATGTVRRDAAVRVSGLIKRYGRVRALDGLDLEVGVGEVHAFLGPNGAGKSTTIRILLACCVRMAARSACWAAIRGAMRWSCTGVWPMCPVM